jgi:hypothetical protein
MDVTASENNRRTDLEFGQAGAAGAADKFAAKVVAANAGDLHANGLARRHRAGHQRELHTVSAFQMCDLISKLGILDAFPAAHIFDVLDLHDVARDVELLVVLLYELLREQRDEKKRASQADRPGSQRFQFVIRTSD